MKKYFRKDTFSLIEKEYTMNYSYLKNFLVKLTNDQNLAEDVVQEVFSRLLKEPEKILEVQYIKSWLVSVSKNILIDHYRKKKPHLLDEVDLMENLLEDHLTPEKITMRKEIFDNVLSNISKEEKTIFLAKEYYGYKYEEISSLMGLPISTIKSRLFRVRKKILSTLERGESIE
ncbi:RNA polymerase sigma factor [Bacillus sp. es.034]|uniref:RNA polymerase sigma factor n=1 Tax=Bacillus sp. es.034 TaxID=1761763 RepID=UPI000BFA04F6|nr:RNA polymerase sigma factor [Bacillus sp. es.034]PFG05289.1 RNA polymerase sigma-70 factor (ECF subfamily) [Bacillus sp. es.034]